MGDSSQVPCCLWGCLLCTVRQTVMFVFPPPMYISHIFWWKHDYLNWTNNCKLRMGLETNWYGDSEEKASGKNSLKREWLLSVYEYFWPLPLVMHSCRALLTDPLVFLLLYRKACHEGYSTVIHVFDTDLTASVCDSLFLQYSALCLGYWLKSRPMFQLKWILIVRIFIGV